MSRKNKPVLSEDYIPPVEEPRTKTDRERHMEQVECPTCKGTGSRGRKPCGLCNPPGVKNKTPGRIWATK